MNTSTTIEVDLEGFTPAQILNYFIRLIEQKELTFSEQDEIIRAINGDFNMSLRDEQYGRLFDWIIKHKSVSEMEEILHINYNTLDY